MSGLRNALILLLLWPALASAQNPGVFSTLKTTNAGATSLCIGCTVGGTTAAANSGMKVATITIESLTAPSVTTNKLYSVSGALTWNGVTLATGSTIAGTTNTIGMFTGVAAIGNSLLTQSGSTVTMTGNLTATGNVSGGLFIGSGASLTSVPTTALTGNFVASVASGTGITSSVTTGNAAATTITLNNTAVTPAAYGSNSLVPVITIDQQGRITAAASTALLSTPGPFTIGTGNNTWTTSIVAASDTYLTGYGGTQKFLRHGNGTNIIFTAATNGLQYINAAETTVIGSMSDTGAVSVGGTNVTDAVATPTIAAGGGNCGTGPTIAGQSSFFTVVIGTGSPTSCQANFGMTFANVPVCTAAVDLTAGTMTVGGSTTAVVVNTSSGMTSGTRLQVLCRGF